MKVGDLVQTPIVDGEGFVQWWNNRLGIVYSRAAEYSKTKLWYVFLDSASDFLLFREEELELISKN